MARTELIRAVAMNEDCRPRWCTSCNTSEGFESDLFAMLTSGLQKIGTFVGCDRCDPDSEKIVCHYCSRTVVGGVAFHRHMVAHSVDASWGL